MNEADDNSFDETIAPGEAKGLTVEEYLLRNEFWKPEDRTRLHLAGCGGNWIIESLNFRSLDGH